MLFVGRAQKKTEGEGELKQKFEQIRQEGMNKNQGVNLDLKHLEETIVSNEKMCKAFALYGALTLELVKQTKSLLLPTSPR